MKKFIICCNNQKCLFKLVCLAVVLLFLTTQSALAQKRVEYSVYGGAGLLSARGDVYDDMKSDGYDFSADFVYAIGGEIKIALSSSINTLFIKPALEFNRECITYSRSSNKSSQITGAYRKGNKLVKYETTQYISSYRTQKSTNYNVLIPLTLGYQFALDSRNKCRMALGVHGFVGLPVVGSTSIQYGSYVAYSPFYDNNGKKVWREEVESDHSEEKTNSEIDFDNSTYGFGGQATFYYWKFSLQYSYRCEKAFSDEGNNSLMYHLLTIGYTF